MPVISGPVSQLTTNQVPAGTSHKSTTSVAVGVYQHT